MIISKKCKIKYPKINEATNPTPKIEPIYKSKVRVLKLSNNSLTPAKISIGIAR